MHSNCQEENFTHYCKESVRCSQQPSASALNLSWKTIRQQFKCTETKVLLKRRVTGHPERSTEEG